jgi:hypothetical protein
MLIHPYPCQDRRCYLFYKLIYRIDNLNQMGILLLITNHTLLVTATNAQYFNSQLVPKSLLSCPFMPQLYALTTWPRQHINHYKLIVSIDYTCAYRNYGAVELSQPDRFPLHR